MPNYETVIIFSPLLAEDDVKREISKFTKMVTDAGSTIVEERTWGLRQLAFPIQGKSNGIYYIMEFAGPTTVISKLELEYKRDENILRFLTVKLDKYGMDYNDRRRKGLVGKKKETKDEKELNNIPAEAQA
ncbi:MAG: 30S ribosomal protein S6 [Chitinophagales bacterium]|jgi:small subunit ribosomal protein S6|nr:30S ribosomal protein S6 [Chitinophagales bacterium]